MAKSEAQRKKDEREEKRKAGLVRIECWVTPEHKALMKRLEAAIRANEKIKMYAVEWALK